MPIDPKATSGYLQNLPAIFSEDPFLGHFLLAFEQVLTGLPGLADRDPVPPFGLEEIIAAIATLFDPKASWDDILPEQERQAEFLQWLAGWVALGLRADWNPAQKRDFLANIVPLYRGRGTKDNLVELLRIYTGLSPVITEPTETDFQIGVHSTIPTKTEIQNGVAVDTQIGGSVPHLFHVSVTIPSFDTLQRQIQIATALIELQKPAHTEYTLKVVHDTMQIGVRSTIGVNTLLGTLP
jgi:phage tail-like protein